MTRAHDDRIFTNGSDKGYSIRVGKKVPKNSTNLAYVHTPGVGPKENLLINDLSLNIKENGLTSTYAKEKLMYPNNKFLLREHNGNAKLPSKNIVLTDEFSVPSTTQDKPRPLYYMAEVKGLFNAKGATVAKYEGGYLERPIETPVDYASLRNDENEELLYLGDKIRITKLDGTPISSDFKYKVRLVKQQGTGLPQNAYKIYIYTNFRGDTKQTFVIRYEKYNTDGTHVGDNVEILNASPFFSKITKTKVDELAGTPKLNNQWRSELTEKNYAIVELDDNNYSVYAPSQVLIANNATRPAHQFKYRVKANLKTKLSPSNPGVIKIGLIYAGDNVFGVENLKSSLWKLNDDINFKPPYLTMENPKPELLSMTPKSSQYWIIDPRMPTDFWHEYDMIIVSGYGFFNMSPYADSVRSYLENGGKIWIDNAGTGSNVLSFTTSTGVETFVTNIGFSASASETGYKYIENENDPFAGRLYVLSGEQTGIGYETAQVKVNPQITFGSGEGLAQWTTLIKYSNNNPSVMHRKIFNKGTIIVSNCGLFRAIHHNQETDIKLAYNIILACGEDKWVNSPWTQDYVYHRDNLFKEEYKGLGGSNLYIDDRNDIDSTQIVAKKIISESTRSFLLPYLPKSYYTSKGTYEVEVQSNTIIPVANQSVEQGTFNESTQQPVTKWTVSTANAIPGWGVRHQAGSTPEFSHIDDATQRGAKAIKLTAPVDGVGSQSYWYNTMSKLAAGSYKATVWVKTEKINAVTGNGVSVDIHGTDGVLISKGQSILGTRNWIKLEVSFSTSTVKDIEVRIGFTDGNAEGVVVIDFLSVEGIGSVHMTPVNDGAKTLYAYAVKPSGGSSLNLKSEGFSNGDITLYDPEVTVSFVIRSYVYEWSASLNRMEKINGGYVSYKRKVRKSDGIINLGSMTTLLPELLSGERWADRNKVYYEILIGSGTGIDEESQFVNLDIYDIETGEFFYDKSGRLGISHVDLFYGGERKGIILQCRTGYYTVRATKRRYGVLVRDDEKIYVDYPSTIDNRDCWFLRVHNGAFTKRELSYKDLKELMQYSNHYYRHQQRTFGTHHYSLPEYNRQIFRPMPGFKRREEEIAEYVNDNTIKVQNAPLYVKKGIVVGELLTKSEGNSKVFESDNVEWLKSSVAKVYVDELNDGNYTQWIHGFDIDYKNGLVIFENTLTGNVKVDYEHNNLRIVKRTYNNAKVSKESLQWVDGKRFVSKRKNWLPYPTPIIRFIPEGSSKESIVPVTAFTIDYRSGEVIFKEETHGKVVADYYYSTDKELLVKDYDIHGGYIYLSDPITFKDEVYVDYYYEENFVEYRGYYDEVLRRFVHLDLNPTEGHYSTLPIVRKDPAGKSFTMFEQVPTAKLMNKEIYVYVVPYKNSFGDREYHTIRHCIGAEQWKIIQKTSPTALLLAAIHLRESAKVTDAVVMDARVRGGGLKESITESQIEKIEPLAMNHWDMSTWDGTAYYKNGVVVIELPKKVLQSEGGQFTEKEVRDIVGKHIAYGIYYIIEFV